MPHHHFRLPSCDWMYIIRKFPHFLRYLTVAFIGEAEMTAVHVSWRFESLFAFASSNPDWHLHVFNAQSEISQNWWVSGQNCLVNNPNCLLWQKFGKTCMGYVRYCQNLQHLVEYCKLQTLVEFFLQRFSDMSSKKKLLICLVTWIQIQSTEEFCFQGWHHAWLLDLKVWLFRKSVQKALYLV